MIKMVFGWIKSKIKREKEDEYERIRQSIIARGGGSSFKTLEEEKPILIEKFRKEEEFLSREEPLEPWERERLEREGIKPEWRPIRENVRETTPIRRGFEVEREFEPTFMRREELESPPYQRKELDRRGLEPVRVFEENERINNRLRFIEEQLATIKAQNEVLIEKLRNIERKLGYV